MRDWERFDFRETPYLNGVVGFELPRKKKYELLIGVIVKKDFACVMYVRMFSSNRSISEFISKWRFAVSQQYPNFYLGNASKFKRYRAASLSTEIPLPVTTEAKATFRVLKIHQTGKLIYLFEN